MFVGVRYHKIALNGFSGGTYTYRTALDLKCGDIVAAPVKNRGTGTVEDKKAMVVEVDLPEPAFACSEIVQMWTEAEA